MRERSQGTVPTDPFEDVFEPALSELVDEEFADLSPPSPMRRNLVEKRRRAELLLEKKRLRDELGDYDLELDDF